MILPDNARQQLRLLFGGGSSDGDPQGETSETALEGFPDSADADEADGSTEGGLPGEGLDAETLEGDRPESDVDEAPGDGNTTDGDLDGVSISDGEAADTEDKGEATAATGEETDSDGQVLAIGPGGGEDPGVVEGDTRAPEPVPFDDSVVDRNQRVERYAGSYPHSEIRQRLRETGVAERIQQRLDRLFSGSVTQVQPRIRNERPGTGIVGGRPDMRQVVRRFAGDLRVDDVFEDPKPGYDDDLAVGVVLDLSSSMGHGEAEGRAKEAAGAFLFGVQKFGGDVVAVSYPNGGKKTALMTAAREPFRWEHLDSGKPRGTTPTSNAVRDGTELLAELSAECHLLLVLTDGGANSARTTRDEVAETRDRGRNWAVVGFGYGNISEGKLETQFGDDGYRAVALHELPDELVDVYREHHPRL